MVMGYVVLAGPGDAAFAQLCPSIPAPGPLNGNATGDEGHDGFPSLATDGQDAWIAVWSSTDSLSATIGADPDIVMARKADVAGPWSPPEPLTFHAQSDSLGDFNPRVTTDGQGTWLAVWEVIDQFGSRDVTDLDIFVARSTNNGVSWNTIGYLNNTGPGDNGHDRNPQLATDGQGHWVGVWWSTENLGGAIGNDADIFVATSINAGSTWSDSVPLNTNAQFDQRVDQFPQIATDGMGHWVAVWESRNDAASATPPMEWDILFARSLDNGVTWSPPSAVNTNAATDEGDDLKPHIATDRRGTWIVVWHSTDSLGNRIGTDDDVLYAVSTNNGESWSAPKWLNRNAVNDDGVDVNPRIATDGQKHWVAVWSADDVAGGFDMDIKYSRSQNNGATWSSASTVNANATTDTGDDDVPDIVTDGAGHWVIAWHSDDVGDGTLGDDLDIIATQFRLTPFDCNGNNVPDECDIAGGASDDCNVNDVPDECEILAGTVVDCLSTPPPCNDGPFFCEEECLDDLNVNGIPDCCEVGTCVPCPPGEVTWIDPPDGVVDARQPHELCNATAVQGIQTITVAASPNARDHCWTLCESAIAEEENAVTAVTEEPAGTYSLSLARPITAGELTTLTYIDFVGAEWTGFFGSLPGDVNADRVTNADDLTAMIDACLNGVTAPPLPPPGDRYDCDLDHSGATTAQDLVRLIDLLNGAGEFTSWLDETVPDVCP